MSTPSLLVMLPYRGEHIIDIFEFWKIRKEKETQLPRPANDISTLPKNDSEMRQMIYGINSVLERYSGRALDQESLYRMGEELHDLGLAQDTIDTVINTVQTRPLFHGNYECTGLDIEINQPTRQTISPFGELLSIPRAPQFRVMPNIISY